MNNSDNENDLKTLLKTSVEVKLSKANRKVYNGPFEDGYGNPTVKYYGVVLEEVFTIFGLYLLIANKIKYSALFILFLVIGSILNGIRFYYMKLFIEGDSDAEFLKYNVYRNAFNVLISIIALLYILFTKK
jgi:heme/copper-type cytochrome/quinol oxidase subunit 4